MKVYLIICACIALAYGRSIPDYFPQCRRSDPEIEKCLLKGVETLRPKLKDGIPEIKLPPLEPFMMDFIHVGKDITGATVNANISNIIAVGASDFNIEYLKVDLDSTYSGEIRLLFPHIDLTADYNTLGSRMLLFRISGSGKFKGSLTGVTVVAKCVASPIVKDGVEFLQLDSITTKVSIGKAEIDISPAESSFTGRAASAFVSASPSAVLNILSPAIDETAALVAKQYLNDILANVPLQDVLIDT